MTQIDNKTRRPLPTGARRGKVTFGKWVLLVCGLAVFVLGSLAGAFLARRRYVAKQVIASVNGHTINETTLFARLQQVSGPATMHTIVEEELRKQFAAKLGLSPTEAQIDARVKSLQDQPDFAATVLKNGQSLGDVRRGVEVQLAQANVFANGVQVTDDEVKRFYDANTKASNPEALFFQPATISIQAVISRAHDKIMTANADITNGTPFDQVAKHYSEDPSSANGGYFPVIAQGRSKLSTIAGFDTNVFGLKIGQQSQPVSIGGAWWIIKCLDKSAEVTRPFDKVKAECEFDAKVAKGLQLHGKDVEQQFVKFQQSASIQAFWPQYQDAVKP